MGSHRTPISGRGFARLKFGLPAILDKATDVSSAFGPRLGFVVMVIGIVAWAIVALAAIKTFGGRLFL